MTVTRPPLPMERAAVFDPPAGLASFPAVSPVRFPSGEDGWVVTGYPEARAAFLDPRLSAVRSKAVHPLRPLPPEARNENPRPGMFIFMDPPDHTRLRKLLTGQFTVHRMRSLEPRIEQLVAEQLDVLAAAGKPADLVAEFAMPVPSLVICELLGVPYSERELFQELSRRMLDGAITQDEATEAIFAMRGFIQQLVEAKRETPGDDILSGLLDEPDISEAELVGVGALLLIAGHETTANMLSLGTFALLRHPDQLRILREHPALMPGAVEELLRYLSVVEFISTRYAMEDVTLGETTVLAGETILIALPSANRDERLAERPDELDLTRGRTHHLAFGHGIHQCLGQQLARIEMRIGFQRLLERFPTLQLAVPAPEVPLRTDMSIYGVHSLPVTW